MEKVRFGLIGCGGRMNCHLQGLEALDNIEVVAVADPIPERAEAAAKRMGAKRIYKNHTELFDNESKETLDTLIIAVEPTAHTDIEERAIEMDLPFIVEKPMTLDLEQADRIEKAIKEKNLITSVGLQDRYLNLMDIVKEELSKYKPGCVVHGRWAGGIPGVWWWQKKSTCGGQLIEQNIHLLDGLRYLFGEAKSIYAVNGRGIVEPGVTAKPEYDTDDYSVCLITFANNVTATLTSSCYSRGVRPSCGLHITLPEVVIDYHLRNNVTLEYADKTIDYKRNHEQTDNLDKAFVDAVLTGDRSGIRSDYSDALKSLKLCFAAEESMATGKPIFFE